MIHLDGNIGVLVLSILGIYSILSTLTWYLDSYKTLEESRRSRKRGSGLPLSIRLKMILALVGGISALKYYLDDPDGAKSVLTLSFFVFLMWYILSGRLWQRNNK